MTLTYTRTFKFSASHFNSRASYETFWELHANGLSNELSESDLLAAFLDIHGHNFIVEIIATGEPNEEGFVVSDIELAEILKPWDGINLSVLPEFVQPRERATTENMAQHLLKKLCDRWLSVDFSVVVHETEDIKAALGNFF